MDPATLMQLIQQHPELAKALAAHLRGQGQQAQGELGTVANMPADVRQGMTDIYTSPDMQAYQQREYAEGGHQADTLGKQPVGAGVGPYNAYVAPHWTQHLNAAANQAKGGIKQNIAQQEMMADILRKRQGSDKYNQYAQQQAKDLLAQQQVAQAIAAAQANEGIPGVSPQLQPDLGAGTPGQDMWHGEGRVPVASGDPQSGPRHDFGPYPPPGAPGQNATRRPRGYIPMPWEKAGPPRGNPWEE
jgi:hypothetical protein